MYPSKKQNLQEHFTHAASGSECEENPDLYAQETFLRQNFVHLLDVLDETPMLS